MTGPALTRGERRCLDWITRCDFTGNGCAVTEDELSFQLSYKRPYISALVTGLERKGYLSIQKRRRPGCKWSHNFYRVRDWNPHVRRGICNLRREFQRFKTKRENPCSDTERTAKAPRAQTPRDHAALTAVVDQRCGREARESGFRRFSVERRPAQKPLEIPGVSCEGCRQRDEELESNRQIIRQGAIERSKLAEDLSSAYERDRVQGKEIATLRRRLTRQVNEDAEADEIRGLLEFWREAHPAAQIPDGGKRWDVAKKALRLMAEDEVGPQAACREALEGARLCPFVRYGRPIRQAVPGCARGDDLVDVLKDESAIERYRGIARRARMSPPERLWAAYEATHGSSEEWFRRAVDALAGVPVNGNGRSA